MGSTHEKLQNDKILIRFSFVNIYIFISTTDSIFYLRSNVMDSIVKLIKDQVPGADVTPF